MSRAGDKLLKGASLTTEDLYILNKAGYFDDVARIERISGANVGKNLQNQSKNIRNGLDDFVSNYKKSDDYLGLTNSQKKKVDYKLKKLSKNGNVAVADVEIDGLKSNFKAHSQINSKDSIGYVEGYSKLQNTDDRVFKNYVDVDGYSRFHDTEAKILEDIASQIKNPSTKGKINLFSEIDCCASCLSVVKEFQQKFPNIKVNVFTNNSVK